MPLQQTSGNVTADAYGGGVAAVPNYIEDVFSTYLYTGNDSTQTINNGIDLSTKGGLVWIKARNTGSTFNCLFDTARGATKALFSNATNAQGTYTDSLTAFNTTGFTLGADTTTNFVNSPTGQTEASWTFRKQPKFFDVVTYTGTGANRTVSHNLGSAPGCIIIKKTSSADSWLVYHRSLTATSGIVLNSTAAATAGGAVLWNSTEPTSTEFTVGVNGGVNQSGETYVAYLFAHNAGGFGLTGTDNVISCGSFTADASTGEATVTLGYEPQWVLVKTTSVAQNWYLADSMRGFTATPTTDVVLSPNRSDAETSGTNIPGSPTATGFTARGTAGQTYIYIAIRRGPMKVPTDATSIFLPKTRTGNGTAGTVVTGASWPMDALWISRRTGGGAGVGGFTDVDRLRGAYLSTANPLLQQARTDAESTSFTTPGFVGGQTNYDLPSGGGYGLFNTSAVTYVDYLFRRAPSFFDEVCYTGDNTYAERPHNLGVVPELWITKKRNDVGDWLSYSYGLQKYGSLNTTAAFTSFTRTASTTAFQPTLDGPGSTYVTYLFATCAGVSKVGSYTGTGSTQTINCGFTGGARFVLIKRTDSTGDWYVYDTARGMTTLTDPYLRLNSTAAESATLGSVTTVSTGFAVNASILAAINTNGASYIYLSIA